MGGLLEMSKIKKTTKMKYVFESKCYRCKYREAKGYISSTEEDKTSMEKYQYAEFVLKKTRLIY